MFTDDAVKSSSRILIHIQVFHLFTSKVEGNDKSERNKRTAAGDRGEKVKGGKFLSPSPAILTVSPLSFFSVVSFFQLDSLPSQSHEGERLIYL